MAVRDNGLPSRAAWQCNKWTGAAAVLVGFAAVVIAVIVAGGMQLASSPSATATTTTRATPFINPRFIPLPVPRPSSSVGSQGTVTGGEASPSSGAGGSGGDWASKALPAYNDVQAGIQAVADALTAQDIDGTKAACGRLADASQRLDATLPSPVAALTGELSAAVGNISTATSACASLGPDGGQAGMDAVTGPLKGAMDHFANAQRIAESGA